MDGAALSLLKGGHRRDGAQLRLAALVRSHFVVRVANLTPRERSWLRSLPALFCGVSFSIALAHLLMTTKGFSMTGPMVWIGFAWWDLLGFGLGAALLLRQTVKEIRSATIP
jgi:hypothetical protein